MIEGAMDRGDLFVKDLKKLVDKVNAPVKDHSAAVLLFSAPVAGNTAATVDSRFNIDDLADLATFLDLLHCEEVNVKASVLVNGEDLTALFSRRDHLIKLVGVHSYGLFADNVLPCFKRLNDDLHMGVVGDSNGNHIYLLVSQNSLERIVCKNASFASKLCLFGVDIVNTGERNHVTFKRVLGMPATHSAVTDDNKIFLHIIIPSFWDH